MSTAREKETYDHLIFSCKAWDIHRASAAKYTMSLLAGLRHDIRGAHRLNLNCMAQVRGLDIMLLSLCGAPCSTECPRYRVISRITPCVPLALMQCPTRLIEVYNTMTLPESLRPDPPLDIPTVTSSKTRGCSDTCALPSGCLPIIERRQGFIDVLRVQGDVSLLLQPHHLIPDALKHRCGSSISELYSGKGRMQYIDVFVHIYLARLLSLIDPDRKLPPARS